MSSRRCCASLRCSACSSSPCSSPAVRCATTTTARRNCSSRHRSRAVRISADALRPGYLAAVLVMVVVALGLMTGVLMPWVDPERLGPTNFVAYGYAFAFFVLPGLFFVSALLFLLATATRSMLGTYIGIIAFFVLWQIAVITAGNLEHRTLGALIDPFGLGAFSLATRYWSAQDRNDRVPDISGILLINRAIWIFVGAALIAAAFALFRPDREGLRWRRGKKKAAKADARRASARHVRISGGDARDRCRRALDAIPQARLVRHARRAARRGADRDARVRRDQSRRRSRVHQPDFRHQDLSGHARHDRTDGRQLQLAAVHHRRVLCRRTRLARAQREDQRSHRRILAARLDSAAVEAVRAGRGGRDLPRRSARWNASAIS